MVSLSYNKGNVIPFKNRKRIFKGRLVTDPQIQKHMKEMTEGFVSQLRAALETGVAATWTDAQRRSWIQSNLPADDCWTCIPVLEVTGELDRKNPGCTVTIEICL